VTFSSPLLTVCAVIALMAWSLSFWRVFKKSEIVYPQRSVSKRSTTILRVVIFLLGVIAWLLISFSLAGPRESIGHAKSQVEANDIMFVVDLSRSMLAEDFKPNRLEVAKQQILDFIKLHPTDRIGIIVYAEKAFTLLPLTRDLDLISRTVRNQVKPGFLGGGTNIGDAIGLGVARMMHSQAKKRSMILLTDGVSIMGSMSPREAATEASNAGIRIFTIGIGGKKEARIPVNSKYGTRYQILPGGSIDIKTLGLVASLTGGKSFLAQDSSSLSRVFFTIDQMERGKVDAHTRILFKERYLYYLIWGVLILLAVEFMRTSLLRESL
jgi:Ca-activated chloride channel homolog